jgi:hypothetical protein
MNIKPIWLFMFVLTCIIEINNSFEHQGIVTQNPVRVVTNHINYKKSDKHFSFIHFSTNVTCWATDEDLCKISTILSRDTICCIAKLFKQLNIFAKKCWLQIRLFQKTFQAVKVPILTLTGTNFV